MTPRRLGTMITYGYSRISLASELDLANLIGAQVLEILPDWRSFPDPTLLRHVVADRGLSIHSAHGCWGGRAIKAQHVDLGQTDQAGFRESVDDLKRCADWLHTAGGTFLVVHPGGLSLSVERTARREALARGLIELAEHVEACPIVICVENMPPGVHPGSRMADLADLVAELARPQLGLALDTGHAHISVDPCAETRAAGKLLRTTHVHDNDGRRDSHDPPGRGNIDWAAWVTALDEVGYEGPIILECIRILREDPSLLQLDILSLLTTGDSRPV